MNIITLSLIALISIIILNKSFEIGNFLNIIDYPNKRKINKNKAVKIGSILFLLPTSFVLVTIYFNNSLLNIEIISLVFIFFFFFLIGFVDDSISLSATKKIILYFIITFIFIKLNPRFEINSLNFYSFDTKDISNISIYFTCFCIISLIIAIDLIDGINLTASIFLLSKLVLVYLTFDKFFFEHYIILYILVPLVLFLFFNAKGKVYLGTGGTCILSFFISLLIIDISKNYESSFSASHILAILLIPGLDMIRVFLIRFFKNGKIFAPDKRHLHHLMEKKLGANKTILILSFIFILTDLVVISFYSYIYYIILSQLIIFIIILKICRQINK